MRASPLAPGSRAFPVALGFVGLVWLLPFVWLVLASFKSLLELVAAPFLPLPERFALDNYAEVFRVLPGGTYLWNTVLMAALIALFRSPSRCPPPTPWRSCVSGGGHRAWV